MTLTLSRSISSCALVLAPAGLPPVSATSSSILRPASVLLFSFSSVAMSVPDMSAISSSARSGRCCSVVSSHPVYLSR